jgi:hypothetical protein
MKIRPDHKWFMTGIILVIALLGTACQSVPGTEPASESSQPDATTETTSGATTEPLAPSVEITPTATPDADPRSELGSSAWGAVFDDGTETWFQFDNDQSKSELQDGKLVLTAKKANSFDAWTMSYPEMDDFYLEVVFTTGEQCAGKDRYGIFFRAPDNTQGYLYNIACDGSYQLRIWDGEQFTDLINWTVDGHIAKGPDTTQRLGVWAEGDHLVLYVNGFQVGEARDSNFLDGTFGVNIAAVENAGFTVDVTEAKAWDIPAAQ